MASFKAGEPHRLLPDRTLFMLFLDKSTRTRNAFEAGMTQLGGHAIDLGQSVRLTEEQFQAEMAERRARMQDRNEYDIGCPLCWAPEMLVAQEEQGQDGPRDDR